MCRYSKYKKGTDSELSRRWSKDPDRAMASMLTQVVKESDKPVQDPYI